MAVKLAALGQGLAEGEQVALGRLRVPGGNKAVADALRIVGIRLGLHVGKQRVYRLLLCGQASVSRGGAEPEGPIGFMVFRTEGIPSALAHMAVSASSSDSSIANIRFIALFSCLASLYRHPF